MNATESLTLPVLGMTCASCQHHVEEALSSAAGVQSAHVDLMANKANVVFDPASTDPAHLVEAIRAAGYDAVLPRAGAVSSEPSPAGVLSFEASRKAWATLAAGAAAMLLAMPLDSEMGPLDHALMDLLPWLYAMPPALLRWSLLVLTAIIVFWAGRGIYRNAWRALRHGATNMNTLVSLGTSVAFIWSVYSTILPAAGRQVYFDAVLLIVGFLLLGKALEATAKRRALAALDSLARLRPVTARRILDGVQAVVPLEEIRIDDSVLVLPGERFPVDAVILEGRTSVDESMLTGEPTPQPREPGGRVLAGSLNYDGAVTCRAQSLGEATVLAQITRMVQQAQSSRAPMERLADRASSIFVPIVLALAAVTYMHHKDFTAGAAHVHAMVSQISNPQTQEQMEAPIALANLLPIGIKGIFVAVLFMGIFGGDATHLLSWGSIFVQDILVPLRQKPFGPKTHLWILRCAIVGVACFAFLFGTIFHLADYIGMWWSITQAVFTTGAGAAILGGLYWKKGTATGAWAAFITGLTLCLAGIAVQQVYAYYGASFVANGTRLGFIDLGSLAVEKDNHYSFALNGNQINFYTSVITGLVYIIVSLLSCREDFNLDRMLHRGEYASMKKLVGDSGTVAHHKVNWSRVIGIDENYTTGDRWIAGFLFSWQMFWFCVFLLVTVWNLTFPWATESWAAYYHITGFTLPIFWAVVVGAWFTWGGLRDMGALFRRLRGERTNDLDDGTVVNNQNLDEVAAEAKLHDK